MSAPRGRAAEPLTLGAISGESPRCGVLNHVYSGYMKNVQITIDDATLSAVDRAAGPLGLKRSEIVRQALREWLRRRSVERFEEDWIAALRKKADNPTRADDWLASQAWGPK